MATFGETLKRERELRKITLREVSEATKIGLRYLEALESNRFDQLPGGLFNKGFIRAYAKFIGLDGEALVNAYLFDLSSQQNPAPGRPRYTGFSLEETAPPVPPVEKKPAPASRRWILAGGAAAALLAAAAGLWLLRPAMSHAPVRQGAPSSRQPDRAEIAPGAVPEAASPAPPVSSPTAPPEGASSQGDGTPSAGGSPPEPSAGREGSRPETAPDSEKPPSGQESLSLVLSTSEPTWIAITCDGVERINRQIAAGNTVRLACQNEIRLSGGNAGTISVQINGNDCLPLGEEGGEVRDFLLDRSRVKELCPAPSPERR